MSEPIRLYDHMGTLFITHSPSVAAQALAAGLLFVEPPAHTAQYSPPSLPTMTRIDIPARSIPGPDDTQDVPVVPTGHARRKGKGNGGVL